MGNSDDERIAFFEDERDALADAIQRRQSSSSIGRTVPWLAGDSERAANAAVLAGWIPPVSQRDIDRAINIVLASCLCVKRGDAALIVETVLRGLGLTVKE